MFVTSQSSVGCLCLQGFSHVTVGTGMNPPMLCSLSSFLLHPKPGGQTLSNEHVFLFDAILHNHNPLWHACVSKLSHGGHPVRLKSEH